MIRSARKSACAKVSQNAPTTGTRAIPFCPKVFSSTSDPSCWPPPMRMSRSLAFFVVILVDAHLAGVDGRIGVTAAIIGMDVFWERGASNFFFFSLCPYSSRTDQQEGGSRARARVPREGRASRRQQTTYFAPQRTHSALNRPSRGNMYLFDLLIKNTAYFL